MTIAFARRSGLTIVLLSAMTLGTTGCELIPGLIAGSSGTPATEPAFTAATLTVTVEQIDGAVEGQPLAATMDVSGARAGLSLQFEVAMASQHTSIAIATADTDTSDANPYGRDDSGDGVPADAGIRSGFDPSAAEIVVCSPNAGCRRADDFGLEIAELAEGRAVVLDATWSGGDHVHLEMRYREQR